ncbi:MAG: ABC transporter ATP-binding protein [Desulfobacteraceae bacterium]|jgi:cobalt/nickel transport system ATP-binding protein
MMTTQTIIQLSNIRFAYPNRSPVFKDLNFTLARGDRIGWVAPNGSGKTTLLHIIMGLLPPDEGRIEIFGRAVKEEKDFVTVRQRIGLLFQDADDQLFSPTVLEDVAFGPLNMGKSKDEAVTISQRILKDLGLNEFEDRVTFNLSGGEKRLVALATVLAMEPEVLLLDEPTSGLDEKTKSRLKEVLRALDISYVLISHEFDFMADMVTAYQTFQNGRIIEDPQHHPHVHEHAHPLGGQPHKH